AATSRWVSTGFCESRKNAPVSRVSSEALYEGKVMKAIGIIRDEHRSLAAVLHGMLYLVREIGESGRKPDFNVLGAMIYYIDAVPERFHHPKEDKYLFALLRARYPAARPLLDRLAEEHRIGAEKIRTLEQALARYQQGG